MVSKRVLLAATSVTCFILGSVPLLLAQGASRDYLPLNAGPSFSLTRIGVVSGASPSLRTRAGASGSTYEVQHKDNADLLVLHGNDSDGKPWSVETAALYGCSGGAHVYEADLDRNGMMDALLWTSTCGNGLAPSAHVVTVTFDAAGRPVPFEAEGYFEETSLGLDSLVDLDGDGSADLIFMNFNDGYWITNVYSASEGFWQRRQGAFAGRVFPLYTRFTSKPNRQAVTPSIDRHPVAPDLSNVRPATQGTVMNWQTTGRAEPTLTVLSDGKQTSCTPDYWFDSARVLLDSADGRTVLRIFGEDRQTVDRVFQQAVSEKRHVRLYGSRYIDRCSPELIWIDARAH